MQANEIGCCVVLLGCIAIVLLTIGLYPYDEYTGVIVDGTIYTNTCQRAHSEPVTCYDLWLLASTVDPDPDPDPDPEDGNSSNHTNREPSYGGYTCTYLALSKETNLDTVQWVLATSLGNTVHWVSAADKSATESDKSATESDKSATESNVCESRTYYRSFVIGGMVVCGLMLVCLCFCWYGHGGGYQVIDRI